jgi:arylformamidase
MRDSQWIDLAQPLRKDDSFGPAHGAASFSRETLWRYEHDDDCQVTVTRVNASLHAGTHVDSPLHFFTQGRPISDYPMDAFLVIELLRSAGSPVTASDLKSATPNIQKGDIVFLRFGYAEHFGKELYLDHPYLSDEAAQILVGLGVSMVGVDTLSPDLPQVRREAGFDFPVHRLLLGAGILIVENLGPNLELVAGSRTTLGAIPLRWSGSEAGPAVAFAIPSR